MYPRLDLNSVYIPGWLQSNNNPLASVSCVGRCEPLSLARKFSFSSVLEICARTSFIAAFSGWTGRGCTRPKGKCVWASSIHCLMPLPDMYIELELFPSPCWVFATKLGREPKTPDIKALGYADPGGTWEAGIR